MTIRFLSLAAAELDEAIRWYDAQVHGLGNAFLVETMKALRLVEAYPEAWQRLTGDIRRCRLARFPYGVIYLADGNEILILAVSHLHRAPLYWRNRLT